MRPNIPNAGEQRVAIARALQKLDGRVDALKNLLESGRVRVEVTNLDDISVSSD